MYGASDGKACFSSASIPSASARVRKSPAFTRQYGELNDMYERMRGNSVCILLWYDSAVLRADRGLFSSEVPADTVSSSFAAGVATGRCSRLSSAAGWLTLMEPPASIEATIDLACSSPYEGSHNSAARAILIALFDILLEKSRLPVRQSGIIGLFFCLSSALESFYNAHEVGALE